MHFDNLDPVNIERLAYQELLKKKLNSWFRSLKANPPESLIEIALEESGLNKEELSNFVNDEEIKGTIKRLLNNESQFKGKILPKPEIINGTNFFTPKFFESSKGGFELWIKEKNEGEANLKACYFKALQWLCQNHLFGELRWLQLATKQFSRVINSEKVSNPQYWVDFYMNGEKIYYIFCHMGFKDCERNLKRFCSITVLENSKTAQYGKDLRLEKL